MTDTVQNIMAEYLRASDSEYNEGMEWYSKANTIANEIANGDVWKGAGVIAAYSPNMAWNQNMTIARKSFEAGYAMTNALGNSVKAAQRIMDGEPAMEVLKGPKVRAFCAAIADPDNSVIATIDRHAYNIAMGTMEGNPKFPIKVFRELSDAYVTCADLAGIGVPQIQAITWVSFRNRKGIK